MEEERKEQNGRDIRKRKEDGGKEGRYREGKEEKIGRKRRNAEIMIRVGGKNNCPEGIRNNLAKE